MQLRDRSVPHGGVRKALTEIRETEFCTLDNEVNDNLGLRPYGHCVFALSEHEFRSQ